MLLNIFLQQIRLNDSIQPRNLSAIAQLGSSSYGIHLGYFASIWMRFILACLGIIGCVVFGCRRITMTKLKAHQEQKKFGYRLVRHLNFFTFLGLPFASAFYLMVNRIIPASF